MDGRWRNVLVSRVRLSILWLVCVIRLHAMYSPMLTAMQGSLQGGKTVPWYLVKDGKWAKGVERCCWTRRLEERPKTRGDRPRLLDAEA